MSIRGCGVGCTPICVLTSQERGGAQKQDPVKRRPEAARGGPGGAASGEVCPADARTATSSLPDHGKARLGEPLGLWHFVTQPTRAGQKAAAAGGDATRMAAARAGRTLRGPDARAGGRRWGRRRMRGGPSCRTDLGDEKDGDSASFY